MVTTRKRKVSSPDAKSKKAAKTAEEELSSPLPSSAEENEQQQQVEEEDQKDQVFVEEEDSPTKKMAAANVLIALTGAVGGDADGEGIDEDESNVNPASHGIPAAAKKDEAESSVKVADKAAAAVDVKRNGEANVDNPQHGEEIDKSAVVVATAAASSSTSADISGLDTEDEKPASNPGNNPGEPKQEVEKETPALTQSILPPNIANPGPSDPNIVAATSVNPGKSIPGTTPNTSVPAGVPTQSTSAAPVSAPAAIAKSVVESSIVEKDEVSSLYVGRVIGKGGEMIRDLQARSGCQIDVDQNVPHGAPRIITYKGTPTDITFAKQLVAMLCKDVVKDSDLPLGKAVRKVIQVPSNVIGKVIGRGGEMIRELQNRSRGKIQVDHSGGGNDENYRQIIATGTPESVVKAEEMINFLCANPALDGVQALQMLIREKLNAGAEWGSGPPYPNLPNNGRDMTADGGISDGIYGGGGGYGQVAAGYGGYDDQQVAYGVHGAQQYGSSGDGIGGIETEVVPCAKMHMGRVIGQKGVTINDLQKRSGCDIQINQQVPVGMDCQISIKGSRQGIDSAKQMIHEIIELGSQHPYAGGHGSRHQYGGQQTYQQQSYDQSGYANQAYSGYSNQAHMQSYNQQYGMPQQQYYGGQPMYPQQPYQSQPTYGGFALSPTASPWRTATSADGQIYYYNSITNETSWDKPPGMP